MCDWGNCLVCFSAFTYVFWIYIQYYFVIFIIYFKKYKNIIVSVHETEILGITDNTVRIFQWLLFTGFTV